MTGAIAAPLCIGSTWALRALRCDDPVGAVAVHLLPGLWGTIAVGFFAKPVSSGGCAVSVHQLPCQQLTPAAARLGPRLPARVQRPHVRPHAAHSNFLNPGQALLELSGYGDTSPSGAGLFHGGSGRQLGVQVGAAV